MMPLETTTHVLPVIGLETPPAATFSLDRWESLGSGLHRILAEQAELGAWHLERVRLSDVHVHEARKATKRLRAVLRMLSDDIDMESYLRLNAEVRDVARELSDVRSAVVQVDVLESLVAADGDLTAGTTGLRARLVASADAERQGLDGSAVQDLSARFEAVRFDIERIEFLDESDIALDGVRKTYRRGRRAMAHAYREPTIESFHIWRKQVKYFRHQMEVLAQRGEPTVGEVERDLREIGEGLGMDHDLADLLRSADDTTTVMLSPGDRRRLSDVISARRVDLELMIEPTAVRVYTAKPRVFFEEVTTRFM
jgi:CHAD domain-containing protein